MPDRPAWPGPFQRHISSRNLSRSVARRLMDADGCMDELLVLHIGGRTQEGEEAYAVCLVQSLHHWEVRQTRNKEGVR